MSASPSGLIRIANAPVSWGVIEFGLEGQTAGYAQVLDEMRESGYVGAEFGDWGFMPTDPATLASGMILPSASPITRAAKASRKRKLCGNSKHRVQASERADVLLLCGDLTDHGQPEEAQVLANYLLEQMQEICEHARRERVNRL